MRAYERFLRYIQYDTASCEENECCPSTEGQKVLGRALAEEMNALGVQDVRMDEHGYVYGQIPANADGQDAIGLIAHMDTISSVPCMPMNARVVKDYDGGDVELSEGVTLRASDCPPLRKCAGGDLIVTDGKTILGADDKAGVAEILTLCEYVLTHPQFPHGKICIGFTPDEEIGRGADLFDVQGFGADYAYTVDGGALAEIEYENFNAASASLSFHGVSIHPGAGKNRMKNAALIAMEFNSLLPSAETPEHTEGYEGFYHLTSMSGSEELAKLHYIVRDHDMAKFTARKAYVERACAYLNEKYGSGTVELALKDSYYNMREKLEARMEVVERARQAMREAGYEPCFVPIRGGTDGARLSFMGLPCPNLSTGGLNGHGRFECVSVRDMDGVVEILKNIVRSRS